MASCWHLMGVRGQSAGVAAPLLPLPALRSTPNTHAATHADWIQSLVGGFNSPNLISRIALLPKGNSETAAESLLALDDAAALAAAERLLAAHSGGCGGSPPGAGGGGGDGAAVQAGSGASDGEEAARQLLLCRRVLYALSQVCTQQLLLACLTCAAWPCEGPLILTLACARASAALQVRPRKGAGAGNSGENMLFFAQVWGPASSTAPAASCAAACSPAVTN